MIPDVSCFLAIQGFDFNSVIECEGRSATDYLMGAFGQHNPKVRFNEDMLPLGAAGYAYCADRWLEHNGI